MLLFAPVQANRLNKDAQTKSRQPAAATRAVMTRKTAVTDQVSVFTVQRRIRSKKALWT
jgi:hypothetical protein